MKTVGPPPRSCLAPPSRPSRAPEPRTRPRALRLFRSPSPVPLALLARSSPPPHLAPFLAVAAPLPPCLCLRPSLPRPSVPAGASRGLPPRLLPAHAPFASLLPLRVLSPPPRSPARRLRWLPLAAAAYPTPRSPPLFRSRPVSRFSSPRRPPPLLARPRWLPAPPFPVASFPLVPRPCLRLAACRPVARLASPIFLCPPLTLPPRASAMRSVLVSVL